ncbi:MAG: F0F1 ATP synthase subunit B [Bacillota bacterium]|nr:F0F1 ATP synthase subunit B [Bacillota bacterium]
MIEFRWYELVWAVINFGILFFLLRKFLFGPVMGMMEKRRQEIAANLKQAEEARQETARLQAEYRAQLAAAQREAQEIMDRAVRAAEETRSRLVSEAQAEAARLRDRAVEAIAQEKEKALAELREEVTSLAIAAASRIIRRTMTEEDERRLVEEFAREMGETS